MQQIFITYEKHLTLSRYPV